MAKFAIDLFLFLTFSVGFVARFVTANVELETTYRPGDVRNCPNGQAMDATKPLHLMEVLPGFGHDSLRNLDLGQVYDFSYASCQVSADGRFLLPDDVYLIPIQNTELDTFSEVFDKFDQYTSETSDSVNIEASYGAVSGKFSAEFQNFKMHMVDTHSISARAQARYKLYTVKIQPDAKLSPHFVSRIMDVTAHMQSNNSRVAHYLADELVRDYGTHVINSVDAGATISKTMMIHSDEDDTTTLSKKDISVSASYSFFVSVKASYEHKSSDETIQKFSDSTHYSHISTHGGPPYRLGNFTIEDWENGILDYLVAIDRAGLPLHTVITSTNMPELADSTRLDLENYIYKAVKRYYDVNTRKGCLDPDSSNFNYYANVDDNSCKHDPPPMNFTFGGIYQTCTVSDNSRRDLCDSLLQKNPLTQDYTCKHPYVAIPLHSGTNPSKQCHRECKHFLFIHYHCHDVCTYPTATYSAYWCALEPGSEAQRDSGYMFGGMYTSTLPNPLTKSSTCPMYFQTLHFGEDMHVCVSGDERGLEHSIPFGGFYSCINGNGLAATQTEFSSQNYPQYCPKTFDQVLATVDEDCQINYCISMNAIVDLRPRPPTLPPYRHKPIKSNNMTDTLLVVYGSNGRMFVKNDDGVWTQYLDEYTYSYANMMSWLELEPETPKQNIASSSIISSRAGGTSTIVVGTSTIFGPSPTSANSSEKTESNITPIVLGSIFGTLFVCSMIVLAVFGIHYARNKLSGRKRSGYALINDHHDPTDKTSA